MKKPTYETIEPERYEFDEGPRCRFSLTRRAFVQSVGAGLLITAFVRPSFAQRGERAAGAVGGRFHIGADGTITLFTGKVEVGQGARTQLALAAAEELRVPLSQMRVVMADTDLVPDDGGTYGSLTTPRTVPTVRRAAAAARELIVELGCEQLGVDAKGGVIKNGVVQHASGKQISLAELVAKVADVDAALAGKSSDGAEVSPRTAWTSLGKPTLRVNGADIVTGRHRYPSDIKRPNMVYGRMLRPPSYGAELAELDAKPAEAGDGVTVVRDGGFVGVIAPTSYDARKAIESLAMTAKWNTKPHPSSGELFQYLKDHAVEGSGRSRSRVNAQGDVDGAMSAAGKVVRASYHVPYIQHAPMETRAAVAEWSGEKLTVWTGTQRPFDVRNDLAQAFGISPANVRLIVPDAGGGFGGKHTSDAAVEAARLAKAAGRPVSLQWTREEEFTWAYFRPAGLLEAAAAIDKDGNVTAWDFTNYNSGGSGLDCPYTFPNKRVRFQPCDAPLRSGSYRALAATANNFAREAFIDRLAVETGADPLAFRLAYLDEDRMKAALKAAAEKFGWESRRKQPAGTRGCGIACGTEKGSFVATCAEVSIDSDARKFRVEQVCVAFECGAVQNPADLRSQIEGCLVMGLGAALSEAIEFRDGQLVTNSFKTYKVPRFEDVPPLDVVVVDRPDLASAGAGETPIIGIAPAIANALLHATGTPRHALPL